MIPVASSPTTGAKKPKNLFNTLVKSLLAYLGRHKYFVVAVAVLGHHQRFGESYWDII